MQAFGAVRYVRFVRCFVFFFQAEDGIRDAQESRGLGDVYKRQPWQSAGAIFQAGIAIGKFHGVMMPTTPTGSRVTSCLLYTSDAADDLLCVDLGGRRIIKKKNNTINRRQRYFNRRQ